MNDLRSVGVPGSAEPLNDSPLRLKLRIEDYLLLDEAGAFASYARTELVDGEIVFMNAQHRPHVRVKSDLAYALRGAVEAVGIPLAVFVEASIAIPPRDVPEPDIVLTSEPEGDGLVPLGSVALVVEVSDASLALDLGEKRVCYANAEIPEYWIADINARVIHQFWAPRHGEFHERQVVPFGTPIRAATIAGLSIPTDKLG